MKILFDSLHDLNHRLCSVFWMHLTEIFPNLSAVKIFQGWKDHAKHHYEGAIVQKYSVLPWCTESRYSVKELETAYKKGWSEKGPVSYNLLSSGKRGFMFHIINWCSTFSQKSCSRMIQDIVTFCCKFRTFITLMMSLIKAYGACLECNARSYLALYIFWKLCPKSRTFVEKYSSAITKKVSTPWLRNAWKLYIVYSNLSAVTLVILLTWKCFSTLWQYRCYKMWSIRSRRSDDSIWYWQIFAQDIMRITGYPGLLLYSSLPV